MAETKEGDRAHRSRSFGRRSLIVERLESRRLLSATDEFGFGSIGSHVLDPPKTGQDVPTFQSGFVGPMQRDIADTTGSDAPVVAENHEVSDTDEPAETGGDVAEGTQMQTSDGVEVVFTDTEGDSLADSKGDNQDMQPKERRPFGFLAPPARRLDVQQSVFIESPSQPTRKEITNWIPRESDDRARDDSVRYFDTQDSKSVSRKPPAPADSMAMLMKHDSFMSMSLLHPSRTNSLAQGQGDSHGPSHSNSPATSFRERFTSHDDGKFRGDQPEMSAETQRALLETQSLSPATIGLVSLVDTALTEMVPDETGGGAIHATEQALDSPSDLDQPLVSKRWCVGTQLGLLLYISSMIRSRPYVKCISTQETGDAIWIIPHRLITVASKWVSASHRALKRFGSRFRP